MYTTKTKFAKQIPISLSKIGQISPEKNPGQEMSCTSVFLLWRIRSVMTEKKPSANCTPVFFLAKVLRKKS
jgi:hypothetical protein